MARRMPGKKLERWTFTVDGVPLTVDCRILPENNPPKFFAKLEALDVTIENTDIKALKKEVEATLKKGISLKWERFYLIEFGGAVLKPSIFDDEDDDATKAKLEFSYLTIEIATRPDGTKCWRKADRWNNRIHDDVPDLEREPDTFLENHYDQHAMIPANPENKARLEAILLAFSALSEKLFAVLHQDRILETISRTINLLGPETPKRKGKA